jgi:type I restriction enzyme S subunit
MSTTTTHIEKKKVLAPKLRFKGFDTTWENKKLGEIINNKSAKYNPDKEIQSFKCIELEHLSTNSGQLLGYIDSINSASIKNKFEKGDVLFGKLRPYLRKYLQAPFDGVCSSEIWVLKGENVSNDFLYKIVQTDYFIDLANQSTGSKMPRADWNVVSSGIFHIPTLPEQQKIASFLSAIDEKIQQLKRKKELLEQYKKGVMQQLFPTVGGQAPKLRFRDENGKAYPKWEKTKLGEVADVKRGAASQHLNYVSDETKGVRLLRINDFLSDGAVYVENTEEMKRYTVKTNDLLIAGTGATAGIIFIVPEKFNNLSFSYNAPRIRVTNAHHTFIYYYLKSDLILRQQKRLFVGNAQPFLDTDAMRGFKINLPSMEEQQKIASYLSSLDTKIESVATQIAQIQTFKKGLLQQMFV